MLYNNKNTMVRGVCHLFDKNNIQKGIATFEDYLGKVKIIVFISKNTLKPGLRGFHVHESGDTSKGCESMGSHFNPHNKNHGGIKSKDRHVGDLGNILIDHNGGCKVIIIDDQISLKKNHINNILNRGLIIHDEEDDLGLGGHELSLTTGNSGKRALCGVIKKHKL